VELLPGLGRQAHWRRWSNWMRLPPSLSCSSPPPRTQPNHPSSAHDPLLLYVQA